MNNRRYHIYSRSFSEFVFRVLKNASASERADLSPKELAIVKNDATISEFVHNHPFDHLLALLAKHGKTWVLRIGGEDQIAEHLEFHTVAQFQSLEKRIDVIESTVREGVHYLSSTDVMMAGLMGAQNMHSPVYSLSANSRDATKRMRAFKSTKSAYHDQIDDSVEAWDDINRIMLKQLASFPIRHAQLVLQDMVDMRILCALFDKRYGAMTLKEVSVSTEMEGKMAFLKKGISRMLKEKLVMSDSKGGKKATYYMISQAGQKKVMQYHDLIYSKTFPK